MTRPTEQQLAAVKVKGETQFIPDLQNFLTWVRSNGIQKSNRFIINVDPPKGFLLKKNYKVPRTGLGGKKESIVVSSETRSIADIVKNNLILAGEDISLPARTISTRTLRLNGLNEQRVHTEDYGGSQGFTVTFLVDHSHDVQRFFEDWMNIMVDSVTREIGEYDYYASTATLSFLRPNYPGDEWEPFQQNFNTSFASNLKNKLKQRASQYISDQVSNVTNQLRGAISKNKFLQKQLTVINKVNRLTGVVDALNEQVEKPSDVSVFSMTFTDVFPRSITRSALAQGNGDVFKLTIEFAFKKYYVNTDLSFVDKKPDSKLNKVFSFLKKSGVPMNKSSLARTGLRLI